MTREVAKQQESKTIQTEVSVSPEPVIPSEKRGFFTDLADFPEYFKGAGKLKLIEREKEILYADFPDELVEIREDGIVYLPFIFFSDRLHKAFGNEWAMIPVERPHMHEDDVICHYVLIIKGMFVSDAYGDTKYHATNVKLSYADCLEGAKSDCLRRVCKAMGIGTQLWQPEYIRQWKEKYAAKKWDNKKGRYKWWKKKPGEDEPTQELESKPKPEKPEPELVDGEATGDPGEEVVPGKWREDVFKRVQSQDFITWCKKHAYPSVRDVRGSLMLRYNLHDVSEITLDMVDIWVAEVMQAEVREKKEGKE